MNQTELKGLLDKYINGTCSKEEIVLLESWYLSKSKQDKWTLKDDDELYLYRKLIWENVQQNTGISQKLKNRRSYQLWSKILVAASIVCVLSVGSYYMFYENPKEQISQNSVKHDLLPGGDKAVLVLSNGKQISLGSAQNGVIAKEENTLVQKNGSNVLSYKESAQYSDNKGQPVYNTVRTPNGGQWPIIELPDGTKAILDAGSSISFPVSFNQERKVTITGQVYFQVVHNSNKPFRVAVNGVTIEDIGTEFNVNAYNDEPLVKTTLIEGSISVVKKAQKMVLKPGQQAITEPGTDRIRSREVNIEEVVAWKNGLFQFNHTHIDVVMRQIARWYDVEIVYKDDVSNVSFSGNLSRNLKASRLLEMMSVTGLHFKIENKKIIVMR